MKTSFRSALVTVCASGTLLLAACGAGKSQNDTQVVPPAATTAAPVAYDSATPAMQPQHHSKFKGALVGGVAGHMVGGKKGMILGAAAGALVQHERNKRAQAAAAGH